MLKSKREQETILKGNEEGTDKAESEQGSSRTDQRVNYRSECGITKRGQIKRRSSKELHVITKTVANKAESGVWA